MCPNNNLPGPPPRKGRPRVPDCPRPSAVHPGPAMRRGGQILQPVVYSLTTCVQQQSWFGLPHRLQCSADRWGAQATRPTGSRSTSSGIPNHPNEQLATGVPTGHCSGKPNWQLEPKRRRRKPGQLELSRLRLAGAGSSHCSRLGCPTRGGSLVPPGTK